MQRKLEEQHKTIQYIKNKYKEKTGEEIVMPKNWQDYLALEEDDTPAQPLPQTQHHQQETTTFLQAVDKLALPTRLSYSKPPLTSFNPTNQLHMIDTIDLSGHKYTVTAL